MPCPCGKPEQHSDTIIFKKKHGELPQHSCNLNHHKQCNAKNESTDLNYSSTDLSEDDDQLQVSNSKDIRVLYEKSTSSKTDKNNVKNVTKKHLYQYLLIGFMPFIILISYNYLTTQTNGEIAFRRNCSFEILEMKYPKQDQKIWNYLKFGVEDLLNNDLSEPKVYLFLHDNNISSRIIINEIAQTASICFDPSLTPVRLEKNDFITDDYGLVIEKYKNNINNEGVLIVVNLNEIPGNNAKALHSICDTYTPIARHVLILLTLAVDDLYKKIEVNSINIAQNKLTEIWSSSITINELRPLITRVTDNVFQLNSE